MHQPSPFEHLLTAESARRYMLNRFSANRTWKEATGSLDEVSPLMGEDMKHFHQLRIAVSEALSAESEHQAAAATRWKAFLRPRIEVLDYWSSAVAAFAGFGTGALAVLAVLAQPVGVLRYMYLVAAGVLAVVLAVKKLELDRHKSWYKYLASHLEAIEKTK